MTCNFVLNPADAVHKYRECFHCGKQAKNYSTNMPTGARCVDHSFCRVCDVPVCEACAEVFVFHFDTAEDSAECFRVCKSCRPELPAKPSHGHLSLRKPGHFFCETCRSRIPLSKIRRMELGSNAPLLKRLRTTLAWFSPFPGKPGAATCSRCHRSVCPSCRMFYGRKPLCPSCHEHRVSCAKNCLVCRKPVLTDNHDQCFLCAVCKGPTCWNCRVLKRVEGMGTRNLCKTCAQKVPPK